ncbi:WASF2 protein, partial [Quiscalus mexicanus]|nr:WASF2 protein [Quiscalus mexicanus]
SRSTMPLVTRNIEPRHLCRQTLPSVPSELECVTNITLANVIRQLGSLSKSAEDIFGELFTQANTFASRVSILVERVDRLQVKVTQLDPKEEEVSLQGINSRKAFKSSTTQDQKLFDRDSLPMPVLETYMTCNTPPPLNILSPYRDDGKEALKFYTDPSYFFDLWKEKMLQDTKDIMKEKRKHRKEKKENPNRGNVNPRKIKTRKEEWEKLKMGQEFVESKDKHGPAGYPSNMVYQNGSIGSSESMDGSCYPPPPQTDSIVPPPPSFPDDSLPPPPLEFRCHIVTGEVESYGMSRASTMGDSVPPALVFSIRARWVPMSSPSLPTASSETWLLNQGGDPFLPAGVQSICFPGTPALLAQVIPADFPDPCLVCHRPGLREGADSLSLSFLCHSYPVDNQRGSGSGGPKRSSLVSPPPPPPPSDTSASKPKSSLPAVSDARSDLLSAIRQGFQLRKVEEQREQEKRDVVGNDVATILSRRIAVEYSDSEDDSSEFDEDEWSD